MTTAGVVIIGAGQGGLQLALSLRQEGYQDPITLLGDEGKAPYQRPPLSKAYLKAGNFDHLLLRKPDLIAAQSIDLKQDPAISLDRTAKTVTCASGHVLTYDRLVFATGVQTRKLDLGEAQLSNVHEIRTAADSDRLRAALGEAGHLMIVGAGFIGLEVAAVARDMGLRVTVIGGSDRVMARSVSAATSRHFEAWHRNAGVDLRLGARPVAILDDGAGRATGLRLSTGEIIEGDLILSAIGVRPAQDLAAQAGLAVGNGILVDELLQSSAPDIYALGDCAAFPKNGRRIRLESVQNAVDHAKALARTLTGSPEAYDKVAWFWSDQGPNKLQIAGLTADADHVEIRSLPDSGKLTAMCFKNKAFIGAETVNAPADHIAARNLLGLNDRLDIAAFRDCNFDLKSVAKALSAQAA